MSEPNYWDDMSNEKLIDYCRAHAYKRELHNDAKSALLLNEAIAYLNGEEEAPAYVPGDLEWRGDMMSQEGFHMTAKVFWAAAARLGGKTTPKDEA